MITIYQEVVYMNAPISSYSGIDFFPKSEMKDGMQIIASDNRNFGRYFEDASIYHLVVKTLIKEPNYFISERHFPTDWAIRIAKVFDKEIKENVLEVAFASTIKSDRPSGYGTLSIKVL